MKWLTPASVIDLGCGLGGWLAAFQEAGVQDIRGVDGDYVRREHLAISPELFTAHDLATPYPARRRYDLAMSVETAEHLSPEAGWSLLESLTELAPVVLFSAAIPHQPGERHVNCQWPAYWADLFAKRGFCVIDCLRYTLWEDERVDWWYRQNIMLYVRADQLDRWPELAALQRSSPARPLPLIHPKMFQVFLDWGISQQQMYWNLYEERQSASKRD